MVPPILSEAALLRGLALALDKADKRNATPEVMADDLIPLLEQAAGKGDCEAMLTLGVRKSLKDGDCAARAAWFLKAAQAGDREAMFETGKCYLLGDGVEKDAARAGAWYQRSADAGYRVGMWALAEFYETGRGGQFDLARAAQWYERSAEAGDPSAIRWCGETFLNGRYGGNEQPSIPADPEKGIALLEKGMAAGDGRCANILARAYDKDGTLARDDARVVACLQQAVLLGETHSLSRLGHCYETGTGTEKNLSCALVLYKAALRQWPHDVDGWRGMASLSETGVQEARTILARNLRNNNADALMGMINYHDEDGPAPDPVKYFMWVRKLASTGNEDAIDMMIQAYRNGVQCEGLDIRPDSLELAFWEHERTMRTGQDAGKDDF